MDANEARRVLGVDASATPDEIDAATLAVMEQNDPARLGGSTYLYERAQRARLLLLSATSDQAQPPATARSVQPTLEPAIQPLADAPIASTGSPVPGHAAQLVLRVLAWIATLSLWVAYATFLIVASMPVTLVFVIAGGVVSVMFALRKGGTWILILFAFEFAWLSCISLYAISAGIGYFVLAILVLTVGVCGPLCLRYLAGGRPSRTNQPPPN
jgi:hypothetical protein